MTEFDTKTNSYKELSIEDKFAKSVNKLRINRPFYSAIYEALKRVENSEVKTMTVNTSEMHYNPEYVKNVEFSELMFTQLHLIGHLALMHLARCGNKDKRLWNLACDLYVNSLLADEFDIEPGEENTNDSVKFPEKNAYCSSIDLNMDYAEKIYETLESQINANLNLAGNIAFKITYKGSLPDYKIKNKDYKYFEILVLPKDTVYGKGFDFVDDYECDIMDTDKNTQELEEETKQILSDANFRYEMSNHGIGNDKGILKSRVDKILESKINWVKLLKSYCRKIKSGDLSFSNPDRRLFYQRAIYPGQSDETSNYLKGIKICIDCSGSISEEDYSYFNGQIKSLLKRFRLDAEVVYWDAAIEVNKDFNTFKDYKDIGIIGGGGTNVSVVFDYFDSKKCKVKPYVTLILTDGYIPMNFDKDSWKRKYKDTIWVLTKNSNKDFKPPFGKVAPVKYD